MVVAHRERVGGGGSAERGGDAPVGIGWSGRVRELQEAEELPFQGFVSAEEGRRWGFVVGRISPAVMAGVASLEVKAGVMGGGDRSGEDQYGVEKSVGYLDWRMWGGGGGSTVNRSRRS